MCCGTTEQYEEAGYTITATSDEFDADDGTDKRSCAMLLNGA